MTSQQILFNKIGLAIASDSAVTVGGSKTYPSVNKIFSLGEQHKVAMMISGAADHIPSGVPWERIFNLFADHQVEPLEKLTDYHLSFQSFIHNFEQDPSTPNINKLQIVKHLVSHFTELIYPAADKEALYHSGTLGRYFLENTPLEFINSGIEKRVDQLIDEIDSLLEYKKKRGHYDGFMDAVNKCQEKFGDVVDIAAKKFCERHQCDNILEQIERLFLHKVYGTMDFTWRPFSNIVIAGFGTKELTPSIMKFQISTNLNWELEIEEWRGSYGAPELYRIRAPIDDDDRGGWSYDYKKGDRWRTHSTFGTNLPFAQHETATTFLMGISDSVKDRVIATFIQEAEGNVFPSIFKEIMKLDLAEDDKTKIAKEFAENIGPRGSEGLGILLSDLLTDFRNYRQNRYDRFIQNMPMEELCKMAHKLIDMEITNAEYYEMIQSVGGKIDVAMITKENGFEWVEVS